MIEIVVAFIAQLGVLGAAVVAARAAQGARRAANGAHRAANAAQLSGTVDHVDQTARLDTIAQALADLLHDVGGLRSDHRQTRTELHDIRRQLTDHLQDRKR